MGDQAPHERIRSVHPGLFDGAAVGGGGGLRCESHLVSTSALLGQQLDVNLNVSKERKGDQGPE